MDGCAAGVAVPANNTFVNAIGTEEYEIDKIIQRRVVKLGGTPRLQYLSKWK